MSTVVTVYKIGNGPEFKRFLDTVIRIPAMVLVRARAIFVRLVAYTVNIDRFFSAWATTERIRFAPTQVCGFD